MVTTPMAMAMVMDMANGYGYAQLRHGKQKGHSHFRNPKIIIIKIQTQP